MPPDKERILRDLLSAEDGLHKLLHSMIQPLRMRLVHVNSEVDAQRYRIKPYYLVAKELEGLTLDEKVAKVLEWDEITDVPHPLLIPELEWASLLWNSKEIWDYSIQHTEYLLNEGERFLTREEVYERAQGSTPEQTLLDLIKSREIITSKASTHQA